MIIMYPLTNTLDYRELQYSLRSVEKYLPGYEVVIVAEHLPLWITNVTWIHVPDIQGRKQLSIKRKIIAAFQYDDEIFFMNDDIFLLQPTDPHAFPFYYNSALREQTESGCGILIKELQEMKLSTKHFDIHTPIVYTKEFIEVAENFTNDTVIKSMYGNFKGIEGTQIADLKIQRSMPAESVRTLIKGRPCFSTGMAGVKSAMVILEELFPEKSMYEI